MIAKCAFPFVLIAVAACSSNEPPKVQFKPRPGSLELIMVANEVDDKEAIALAQASLANAAKDPALKAELDKLAEEGKPPPAPKPTEGETFVVLGEEATYVWAPLAGAEVKQLNLHGGDDPLDMLSVKMREAVKSGETYLRKWQSDEYPSSMLLWGRKRGNRTEYFTLLRRHPIWTITEASLADFTIGIALEDRPAIDGKLTAQGGKLFAELTERNRPGSQAMVKRQLAIVVNGRVLQSPVLQSKIADRFQITGDFTVAQLQDIIAEVRNEGPPGK